MKKIFTLLSLLTLVIVSCEEPAPEVYSDGDIAYYLDGTSGAFTITSPDDVYSIAVVATNTSSQDRAISIEIDESSTATADQYVISDQLIIPANSYTGTIDISGVIATVVPGSKLVINLSSVDGTAIAGFQNSFSLDLYLYCAFDRDSYIGDYVADEEGYGEYDVTLAAGIADNELVIYGLYAYSSTSTTSIFITEPSNNEFVISGTEDYLDNYFLTFNSGTLPSYMRNINGTTNSCTKFMDFEFSLYFPDLDGYPFGEDVGITLTKK